MLGGILRALFGFVLACLCAGIALALFVYTPAEFARLPRATALTRLGEVSLLAFAIAAHAATFAVPFAVAGAAVGAWYGIRNVTYYMFAGLVIAGLGFASYYKNEMSSTLAAPFTYALSAFGLAGAVAGFAYWLCAGRWTGKRQAEAGMPGTVSLPEGR